MNELFTPEKHIIDSEQDDDKQDYALRPAGNAHLILIYAILAIDRKRCK
jgi:hypothetical protein